MSPPVTLGHRNLAGTAILASAVGALLSGCGHAGTGLAGVKSGPGRPVIQAGLPFLATKNTTRVAGSDPTADAAAVAGAVFPFCSNDTPPPEIYTLSLHDALPI